MKARHLSRSPRNCCLPILVFSVLTSLPPNEPKARCLKQSTISRILDTGGSCDWRLFFPRPPRTSPVPRSRRTKPTNEPLALKPLHQNIRHRQNHQHNHTYHCDCCYHCFCSDVSHCLQNPPRHDTATQQCPCEQRCAAKTGTLSPQTNTRLYRWRCPHPQQRSRRGKLRSFCPLRPCLGSTSVCEGRWPRPGAICRILPPPLTGCRSDRRKSRKSPAIAFFRLRVKVATNLKE